MRNNVHWKKDIGVSSIFWEKYAEHFDENKGSNEASRPHTLLDNPAYKKLMMASFRKRLKDEEAFLNRGEALTPLRRAAVLVSNQFELKLTRAEQLQALRNKVSLARAGPLRFFPPIVQKSYDFMVSIYKKPNAKELTRNAAVGALFVLMTLANPSPRSTFGFYIMGLAVSLSALLTRNMPIKKTGNNPFAMDREAVVNFSSYSAFRHALLITLLFSVSAFISAELITMLLLPTSWLPEGSNRHHVVMALSTIATFICNSYFEVYEEKGRDGWRWEKIEEQWSEGNMKRLTIPKFTEEQFTQLHTYKLSDDMIDEGMADTVLPLSKDPATLLWNKAEEDAKEHAALLSEKTEDGRAKTQAELAEDHYQIWLAEREAKKRIAAERAVLMTDHNVGAKPGFLKNTTEVSDNVLYLYEEAMAGRHRYDTKIKDSSGNEKEKDSTVVPKQLNGEDYVPGPLFFRDVEPKWMRELFNGNGHRDFTTGEERAAQYGIVQQEMRKGTIRSRPEDEDWGGAPKS